MPNLFGNCRAGISKAQARDTKIYLSIARAEAASAPAREAKIPPPPFKTKSVQGYLAYNLQFPQ